MNPINSGLVPATTGQVHATTARVHTTIDRVARTIGRVPRTADRMREEIVVECHTCLTHYRAKPGTSDMFHIWFGRVRWSET
jgi:polyferredoxin